jgi:signal recognition particle receptor subunit alpha
VTPENSRPSTPSGHILASKSGPGGKLSRRARKVNNFAASSGDEASRKSKGGKTSTAKKGRRWDADGLADEDDDTQLDYSIPSIDVTSSDGDTDGNNLPGAMEAVDQESWGSRTGKGQFVLKDLDDQVHAILSSADSKKAAASSTPSGIVNSSLTAIGGLFRNVVGGKVLTKVDLDKAMKGMEDHLLKKNVAREAAMRLCDGVERELIGAKTGNFESK